MAPNSESLLMEYLLQASHVIVRIHDALPMSSVADADLIYISRHMRGEDVDCRQRTILCDLLRHVVRMIHHYADQRLLCVLVAIVTGDALFFGGAAICGVMSLMALMAAVCHDNRVERQKMEEEDDRQ